MCFCVEKFMLDEALVILDFSPVVQNFLEQQDLNLYQELQEQMPSLHLEKQQAPDAYTGSKDIVTIIAVSSTLITALTPLIIRILDQYTPPNRSETWIVEETETTHPDGTTTIYRKRVLSNKEQHVITSSDTSKKE